LRGRVGTLGAYGHLGYFGRQLEVAEVFSAEELAMRRR
jgi:hypothetical protein